MAKHKPLWISRGKGSDSDGIRVWYDRPTKNGPFFDGPSMMTGYFGTTEFQKWFGFLIRPGECILVEFSGKVVRQPKRKAVKHGK